MPGHAKSVAAMDQEDKAAEHEKAAQHEVHALKKTAAADHKAFTDAQQDTWEAVKLDYEAAVEKWIEDGQNGAKLTHLKQCEVCLRLGLDNKESWNGA